MTHEEEAGIAIEWWLESVDGIGPKRMQAIEDAVQGEFERLSREDATSLDLLLSKASIPESVRARITQAGIARSAEVWEAELGSLPEDVWLLHRSSPDFPQRLSALGSPPRFLFARGNLGALNSPATLSVVGSRDATVRGVRQTREMASAAASADCVVVSGGARGVDAAAHRGALDAAGRTIVVLPSGVDSPGPSKNARIFRGALRDGCLISEYPSGTSVRKFHFHRRNRLLAALGDWLLVTRAARQSGTMITARAAAQLGRPIMAFPGPGDDGRFGGCVDLLAAGAACVRHSGDVLYLLNSRSPATACVDPDRLRDREPKASAPSTRRVSNERDEQARARLGDEAARVLSWMEQHADGSVSGDELRRECTSCAVGLESALLELELGGVVEKVPGKNAYEVVK